MCYNQRDYTVAQFAVRKRFAVWCKEREYIAQFAVRMRFAVWCKEREYIAQFAVR